jgi:hypothetical protein
MWATVLKKISCTFKDKIKLFNFLTLFGTINLLLNTVNTSTTMDFINQKIAT